MAKSDCSKSTLHIILNNAHIENHMNNIYALVLILTHWQYHKINNNC